MRTHQIALALAASLVSFALTACSGDPQTTNAPEATADAVATGENSAADPAGRATDDTMTLHPCLLMGDEVSSVLGGNYDDGVLSADFSAFPNYVCDYTDTDTGVANVAITAIMPRGFTAEQQRPGYESTFADVVDVTVEGANYAFTAKGGTIVAVQVGEYTLFVASNANGDSDPDGHTLRLAQIAVSHA